MSVKGAQRSLLCCTRGHTPIAARKHGAMVRGQPQSQTVAVTVTVIIVTVKVTVRSSRGQ